MLDYKRIFLTLYIAGLALIVLPINCNSEAEKNTNKHSELKNKSTKLNTIPKNPGPPYTFK